MAKGKVVSCPECGSTEVRKHGVVITRRGEKQRFLCRDCGRTFLDPKDYYKPNYT